MHIDNTSIYSLKESDLFSLKRVLILKSFPGINARLFFSKDLITYNDTDINEEFTDFNEDFFHISKHNPQLFNLKLFCILTGDNVIKQKIVQTDFHIYVYAAFNTINNTWLEYEEIQNLFLKDLTNKISFCPILGTCETNINNINDYINDNIYSILIMPYPTFLVNRDNILSIIEYINPLYEEDEVDYSKHPYFVYDQLSKDVDDFLNDISFRIYLAKYCIINKKEICDFNVDDINSFKIFIMQDLNYEKDYCFYDIFIKLCNIKIRKKCVDFLLNDIV